MTDMDLSLLKSRMGNFRVEVKTSDSPLFGEADELLLSVTQNGHQWQGIRLLPNEARKVILALENYLTTLEDK